MLDALKNGDRNGNGFIELVAHAQDQVPRLPSSSTAVTEPALLLARGSIDDRQSARFGSRGEDFSVGRRLQLKAIPFAYSDEIKTTAS